MHDTRGHPHPLIKASISLKGLFDVGFPSSHRSVPVEVWGAIAPPGRGGPGNSNHNWRQREDLCPRGVQPPKRGELALVHACACVHASS